MHFADQLVAHRGYPARLPENTLPSIEAALQAGARYIEVDVQLSKDAKPVLFHDRDLQRLCGLDGAVHDYNWRELQVFRVHDQERFPEYLLDIAIPHLNELVSLLQQHPEVTVFVELKRISLEHFGVEAMIEQLVPLLQPIQTQAVLISYSLEALQHLREVSKFPLGVVIDDWQQRGQSVIQAIKPEYLFCDLESVPATGQLDCRDYRLVLFECTDPQQAYKLLQRGTNLVETFAIGEMIAAMSAIGAPLE